MAKKSKSKQNIAFVAVSIILAVIAICMMFTNVCGIKSDENVGYILTGVQATFGFSEQTRLLGTVVYTSFSFLNLLTYLLLATGIVLALLRLFKVIKPAAMDWLIAGLFVASGVLFFLTPSFVVYGAGWADLVSLALKTGGQTTLMVGSIVGGLSSILAAGTLIAGKFVKK